MSHTAALSLLLIALCAFIAPPLSRRVGIPAAVGEIILGIILGSFGLVAGSELVHLLAQLGLIILMFTAGYEVDFEAMEQGGIKRLLPGVVFTALIFLLSGLACWYLGLNIFYFLAITAMSVGLGAAFLKETNLIRTPSGQAFLMAGSMGEFATIVVLTFILFLHRFGVSLSVAYHLAGLLLIFAVAYLVLVLLRTLVWWFPEGFVRLAEAYDSSEIGVRAGFALAFIFIAIAAFFDIEPILGAFIAGALFGFVFRDKEAIEPRFSAVGYGFLIPVFFISVGANFRPLELLHQGPVFALLGIIVGLSLLFKVTSSPVLMFGGLPFRGSLGVGFLVAAPLSLQVVVAEVGLRAGALDETGFGVIVLSAMVLGLVAPVAARLLLKPLKKPQK